SGLPHEAVIVTITVSVVSRGCPQCADAVGPRALSGIYASARNIEGNNGATRLAQEAVIDAAGVEVVSHDRSPEVDRSRFSSGCSRHVKCSESTIALPHIAVFHEDRVKIPPDDGAFRVNTHGVGAVDGFRRINCGDPSGPVAQETVIQTIPVHIDADE